MNEGEIGGSQGEDSGDTCALGGRQRDKGTRGEELGGDCEEALSCMCTVSSLQLQVSRRERRMVVRLEEGGPESLHLLQ